MVSGDIYRRIARLERQLGISPYTLYTMGRGGGVLTTAPLNLRARLRQLERRLMLPVTLEGITEARITKLERAAVWDWSSYAVE